MLKFYFINFAPQAIFPDEKDAGMRTILRSTFFESAAYFIGNTMRTFYREIKQ